MDIDYEIARQPKEARKCKILAAPSDAFRVGDERGPVMWSRMRNGLDNPL